MNNYKCKKCGVIFNRLYSKKPVFCSKQCQYAMGHSEDTKRKIREWRKTQTVELKPIKRSGYWYIKDWTHPNCGKQGYVAMHRIVMEKHIGRFLKPMEIVHHKDGDITNNSIENLELFATPGEHTAKAHPENRIRTSIANKGKHYSRRTEFKKGMIPWNKKK